MKRRIFLAVLAAAGTALALVVGISPAAGKVGHRGVTGGTTFQLTCKMFMTTVPPPGSSSVVAPVSQGNQYGGLNCGQSPFYGGAIADSFTVPDSGDMVGTYVEYLNTGTIRGTFDLTPQEGQFGGGSFQSQTWTGVVSVRHGTGHFKQISAAKYGTMDCSSGDSVHLTCTESISVYLIPPRSG